MDLSVMVDVGNFSLWAKWFRAACSLDGNLLHSVVRQPAAYLAGWGENLLLILLNGVLGINPLSPALVVLLDQMH